MFIYPKVLRAKDLKKISKYPCDESIKDAYLKYLTNYSFSEFAEYCAQNEDMPMDERLFSFTDLQLEKFEPNSLIWVSHVMVNFMIYVDVNLDYGECYDAYASALQLTVLSCAMKMAIEKIPFSEVEFPEESGECFEKLFLKCPDFSFDLERDSKLAFSSFNTGFDFTSDEFYGKVNDYLSFKYGDFL